MGDDVDVDEQDLREFFSLVLDDTSARANVASGVASTGLSFESGALTLDALIQRLTALRARIARERGSVVAHLSVLSDEADGRHYHHGSVVFTVMDADKRAMIERKR